MRAGKLMINLVAAAAGAAAAGAALAGAAVAAAVLRRHLRPAGARLVAGSSGEELGAGGLHLRVHLAAAAAVAALAAGTAAAASSAARHLRPCLGLDGNGG